MSFLDELAKKGFIKKSEIDSINKEINARDVSLEETLKTRGILEKDLLSIRSEYLKIPSRTIDSKGISFEALKYVPEESATFYNFVPLGVVDGVLEVGMTDPDNIEARDALQFISSKMGIPFKIFLISLTVNVNSSLVERCSKKLLAKTISTLSLIFLVN